MKLPWQPCTAGVLQHMVMMLHCCISFGGPIEQHSRAINTRACSIHFVIACLCQKMNGTLTIIIASCLCARQGGGNLIIFMYCWLDLDKILIRSCTMKLAVFI